MIGLCRGLWLSCWSNPEWLGKKPMIPAEYRHLETAGIPASCYVSRKQSEEQPGCYPISERYFAKLDAIKLEL